jgi:hypothetical protein
VTQYAIPASWRSPMPGDALARLVAGVRSFIGHEPPTEAMLDRRRECDGADVEDSE